MMNRARYQFLRTLRCKNLSVPGTLGRLTATIGQLGIDVGNIATIHLGHQYTVRDIDVFVDSEEHLAKLIEEISLLREVTLLEVRDDVLERHKNGKIEMISTVSVNSVDELRRIYTPGVAEVCKLITEQPELKDTYTSIPHFVAIVTDGSAILGLGNIGPIAGMPVMEGKAAILHELVGISGIPILLDVTDPDTFVETVKHISPTFGGIQLEDIASPRCFVIESRLDKELGIPVMHDDQHGTAVVTLAALINACKSSKISLQEAKVGLIGLGAAGLSIGKFLLRFTGNPALGVAKTEASIKRHAEAGGIPSSLDEVMQRADVVIATSGVAGLIKPGAVKKGQIIFALSNPYPEISTERAIASGAALAVDGRTVNNLLGYPGIWRGALDSKSTKITYEMYLAAALAVAATATEGELVPNALESKVHIAVAHNVAKAALECGVAQRQLSDDYFENSDIKRPLW